MNINIRAVVFLVSSLVFGIGVLMFIPAVIAFVMGENSVHTFFILGMVISFFAGSLVLATKSEKNHNAMTVKDILLLTSLSWLAVVIFASLPYKFGYLNMDYTDAFFETMSGFTTTGASIITDLDELNYSFHFWRILTGWLGGIGVIFTAIIMLPSMQGGMRMFRAEAFETFGSAFSKAKKIALGILLIYVLFTLCVMFALIFIGNLSFFDSLIHAFTTISTTGFSNQNNSIASFDSVTVEIIITLAMSVGGIPYILIHYIFFLNKFLVFKDRQVRGYVNILLISILILVYWLITHTSMDVTGAIRYGSFTVISLLTGTGLTSANYNSWGTLPIVLLLILMIIGGCAGSKSAGLKVYRIQVAFDVMKIAVSRVFLGKHVMLPTYNDKVLDIEALGSIFAYIFLYFVIVFAGIFVLSYLGVDFFTALFATVASISNVGPGFGDYIGPTGNYSFIPSMGKWILGFVMLLGRLEIFVVLAIFNRRFWI